MAILYPTRIDLNIAVQNSQKCILDSILASGIPKRDAKNMLVSYNGGFSCVYPVKTKNATYALRCWTSDIGDGKDRYREIDKYIKQIKLPYFVDFNYIDDGILVKGKRWPIIRMEWVDGVTLKEYIVRHVNNAAKLNQLAADFQKMVAALHVAEISHGDLQHGNIMVKSDGTLKLVDYDSLYVPALKGKPDLIKGLPSYQHPGRYAWQNLTPKADYFSELIIYLSIKAIAVNPDLFSKYNLASSDELLFSIEDLQMFEKSSIYKHLMKSGTSEEVKQLAEKLRDYCSLPFDSLSSLEGLLENPPFGSASAGIIKKLGETPPPPPPSTPKPSDAAANILDKLFSQENIKDQTKIIISKF